MMNTGLRAIPGAIALALVLGAGVLLTGAPATEPSHVIVLNPLRTVPRFIEPAAVSEALAQTNRAEASARSKASLIIPVDGVPRSRLADSFGAPRSGGRSHKGIDIMAPEGTIVRATADGRIVKLFRSDLGGNTIYQTDKSGRIIFYYAHLNRYAAGLSAVTEVVQGQTIGYVGQTGNAPVPHLHFEIQAQTAGRKWWRGIAMNPYPVLKAGTLETLQASAESVRLRPARAAQY